MPDQHAFFSFLCVSDMMILNAEISLNCCVKSGGVGRCRGRTYEPLHAVVDDSWHQEKLGAILRVGLFSAHQERLRDSLHTQTGELVTKLMFPSRLRLQRTVVENAKRPRESHDFHLAKYRRRA